jgi:endonuclease/exonuclease/phosphatase family metal-dependent hydrolase
MTPRRSGTVDPAPCESNTKAGRGLLRAAAVLLMAAFCLRTAFAQVSQAPPPLRFVTFNLLHGGVLSGITGKNQHLDERLAIAAEGLRALRPDIVGVQEASEGRGRGNVAERLAAKLRFHYVYAPTTPRLVSFFINFSEGPAILSRFPIVASEVRTLPWCGRLFDPRVLLYALVRTPWGDLAMFSTHTSGDPCQTRRVAELVKQRRSALPAVLVGDFNAAEDSPAVAAVTRAGFLDVFRRSQPEKPGFTVWQRIDSPLQTVRRRVDYLFLLRGTAVRGSVVCSEVVLDAPQHLPKGGVLWPSDHYGVMADISVFRDLGENLPVKRAHCRSRGPTHDTSGDL